MSKENTNQFSFDEVCGERKSTIPTQKAWVLSNVLGRSLREVDVNIGESGDNEEGEAECWVGKGHGELDTELVMGMLLQKGVRSLETYTLEMD